MPTKNVSSTVDEDLLQQAKDKIGPDASAAEAIRQALHHFVGGGGAAPALAYVAVGPTAAPAVATAAKPVAAMTDDEELACLRLLMKSRGALEDARDYLVQEEAVADMARKKELRIAISDVKADLAKVNARIDAFQAEKLSMTPPSAETVGRISQLAEEVGQLTLQAQRDDQVIAAIKNVVNTWTGTQV